MWKIRNYTTEIKLITKQITYFCGVIQSEITTEQRNGKETGQKKNYRLASEEQYFIFKTVKRVIRPVI